jgi:hypothetical protein
MAGSESGDTQDVERRIKVNRMQHEGVSVTNSRECAVHSVI